MRGVFLSFEGKWLQCFENKKTNIFVYMTETNAKTKEKKIDSSKSQKHRNRSIHCHTGGNGFIDWIRKRPMYMHENVMMKAITMYN